MNIGTHLRDARERRGLSLHQIAQSTKLSTATLRHIEENEFSRLPGGIFVKGYLRACASAVGVDPEEVVEAFVAQLPQAAAPDQMSRLAARLERRRTAGRRHSALATVAVLFLAFAAIAAWYAHQLPARPAPSADSVAAPVPIEPLVSRAMVSDARPASEHDGTVPALSLEIQSTGACWVSVTADGRLILYRLLESGERVTATAQKELVLRVGDPSMFEYRVNGIMGRPLGEARRPVTIEITPDNYESYLDTSATLRAISST